MWTRRELLDWTTQRFADVGVEQARGDAQHLLAHALGCSRIQLLVESDLVVGETDRGVFRELIRRRLKREPVAYIEGTRGFHALDLELGVDPRVLIPRPETEHLVDWALEYLAENSLEDSAACHVLDVGTGSGAIALAIKHARPNTCVHATDISVDALRVARKNADRAGLDIHFTVSNLLDTVRAPPCGWSAIVANLPYIPHADLATLQPEVRDFEPRSALDGGPDGLDLIRSLTREIAQQRPLRPGGALFLEIGVDQAATVGELLRTDGLRDVETRRDLSGIERVVTGRQ